jgi:hypothetical protein
MPTHHWTIDAIAEDTARIEEDGERMRQLPRWLLPDGAKAGQVLRVEREPDGKGRVRLTISIDEGETRAGHRRSEQQVAAIREDARAAGADPGGDVAL